MPESLELHEIVDSYLHNLVALHEVVPYQMLMATSVAKDSSKKYKQFLDEKGDKLEEDSNEGSTSYQLNYKDVRRSTRLGLKSERSKTVLDLLPRNFAVSYVSEYDSFLGQLLKKILLFKPEIIDSKDKNISLSDLVTLGSVEAARERIIDKEVESVLRSSHSDQFTWMENVFSLALTKGLDSWPTFIELTERRNLFVHCDGIVSEQYLKVCEKYKVGVSKDVFVGHKLLADKKHLKNSYETLYEIGLKLSQVLWRKLAPNDIEKAEDSLSHFIYELLIEENYSLARNLLDFACCTLKKWNSESARLMYVINRAIAYKFSGKKEISVKILESQDWSACGENYQLCVAVLMDDFDKAKKLMLNIGSSGSVNEGSYLEWPCFKVFRESDEFTEAFTEVFGHAPTLIEQIDITDESSVETEQTGAEGKNEDDTIVVESQKINQAVTSSITEST